MKAIISAATNSFADVVYFMFSPGKKIPALLAGQMGDNVAVHSHPIVDSVNQLSVASCGWWLWNWHPMRYLFEM